MMHRWQRFALVAAISLQACFDPVYPEGIPCSEVQTCPPEQTCDLSVNVCRRMPVLDRIDGGSEPSDGAKEPIDAGSSRRDAATPDVDAGVGECSRAMDPCGPNGSCFENDSGYGCACQTGYELDGTTCVDTDECAAGASPCGEQGACVNEPGAFRCDCNPGYAASNGPCVDIDECAPGTASCHAQADCLNTEGGFDCVCRTGYVGDGQACRLPRSCLELSSATPGLPNGVYDIDVDEAGPASAMSLYCDMAGGGWTLIMNQVPSAALPDIQQTVNPAGLGTLDQSYRLGNPTIRAIAPTIAWKLTDDSNQVFFTPACTVDWTINYLGMPASPCTVGYTDESFSTAYNGGHINVSTRGIGINNSARHCSIRAYNTVAPTSIEAGPATSCLYTKTQTVRLWYR